MEVKQGYKQTELGVIPKGWDVKSVIEIAEIATGTTPPTRDKNNYGEDFLFVSPADLGKGKYINNTEKKLSKLGFSLARKYPANSILFTCIGSTIGKAGISKVELSSNQQINAVFPCESYSSDFLYYYLIFISPKIKLGASEQAVPMINKTEFGKTQIVLPLLSEQTAIANALSDMDALISQTEKLIEKKKAIKQGAMQELLKPKDGWGTKKLGDVILSFQNGNAFSAIGYVKNGTPIVTMAQIGLDGAFNFNESKVNRWVISDFNFLKSYHLKNGDLIMAMTDVTPEKNLIGRMALVKTKETLLLNQRVGLLRIDSSKTNAYFLKTISNMEEWRSYCIGIASLGVQANIGTKDILNGEILMPEVTVQNEIAEILTTMDNELSQIQHKLAKLKQQKQGMMQALLTGKIRLVS
jgi:type I restriction enzyme S subunit